MTELFINITAYRLSQQKMKVVLIQTFKLYIFYKPVRFLTSFKPSNDIYSLNRLVSQLVCYNWYYSTSVLLLVLIH